MSDQADIEAALVTLIDGLSLGFVMTQGPLSQPQAEGDARVGFVRFSESEGDRLAYGQTQWEESYQLTLFWRMTIARGTRLDEWESIRDALLADQYLGGAFVGLEDAYLSSSSFSESLDAHFSVVTATVTVSRVE